MFGTSVPWAVVISLGVLCLAFLIRYLAVEVIEDENHFVWIILFFFIAYAGAALAVGSLNPIHFITDGLAGTSDDLASQ
jgi:hypothetical protein